MRTALKSLPNSTNLLLSSQYLLESAKNGASAATDRNGENNKNKIKQTKQK
jgi:hypothetical protein